MEKINLLSITRQYKNNGQHAEQVARYTLTGEIVKADNKPFTAGGDCLDIQIKSSRATICKGLDIQAHIQMDGAGRYGYVTNDFATMYIMSKQEYLVFATTFGTITKDSAKNGGQTKIRFKQEGAAMKEWLRQQA